MEIKNRLAPLDLLRGTLIILMALDHATFQIAHQHSPGEYWGGVYPSYSTPLNFLTRFVTHVCAPGFFFLMGMSMVLFLSSRRGKGWTEREIRVHFLVRGMVLIGIQGLLNLLQVWALPGGSAPILYVGVLAALGTGMILAIPLLDLKPVFLALLGAGLFLGMELCTPDPAMWGRSFDNTLGSLLIYGGGRGDFWVNYPLLAWMEVVVLGLWFGKMISRSRSRAYCAAGWLGGIFLGGFVLLRLVNGFGNIRPFPGQDWMDFFSMVKYPPSMAYVLFTMGINLILLWLFSRLPLTRMGGKNPLLVFGRTALFSYLGHIGIYLALGRLLTRSGTSLQVMYVFWLVGLALLYYPAVWYGKFKARGDPGSWVRFL